MNTSFVTHQSIKNSVVKFLELVYRVLFFMIWLRSLIEWILLSKKLDLSILMQSSSFSSSDYLSRCSLDKKRRLIESIDFIIASIDSLRTSLRAWSGVLTNRSFIVSQISLPFSSMNFLWKHTYGSVRIWTRQPMIYTSKPSIFVVSWAKRPKIKSKHPSLPKMFT